ncbi:MAG TPA: hypothetical protein VFX96_14705 [Pyrinomonadaceae bacterium]|nr:hypothetical protein [Pyrinomonadaceae bacterium]
MRHPHGAAASPKKFYPTVLTAMRQLRNYGVYRLPDGLGYVAVRGGSGKYYLFSFDEWPKLPPVFEVTTDGQVLRWFNSGPEWLADQLEDTGESATRAATRAAAKRTDAA